MLGNSGGYATKKRKKPVLKQKKISEGNGVVKSNPSKRHRDRLNGELDRLTDLLPFSEDVRTRLDKLSVLRLSVGYLRVKSYFKATPKNGSGKIFPALNGVNGLKRQNGNNLDDSSLSEGDLLLQALNGFVIVVASDGLVFYASSTIKDYLGFHQSDVVHQSVFDLIHTDDRDLFRQQLHFAMNPPLACVGGNVMYSPEQLPPENSSFLERTFICRFRCLLDNSSGFLALKFQGRLKYLHGQSVLRDNQACNKSQLALFTIAIPVQPPAILEIRAKMLLFQTKHKLDFTPTGIDTRGKVVLGYSELEISMKGSGYQFIHAADMIYCADKHMNMIKTGETGLTVFRLLCKSNEWVWVKSNAKLIYKGGRPEFIIANQKAISNAEGEEYLRQRTAQLPFGFTTGEAVLYSCNTSVDISLLQFNKKFNNNDMSENVPPGSLLDCFLKQDDSVYTKAVDSPSPVDQVFMESHALVSIPSDAWQDAGVKSNPAVVKEEAKQSVMAVFDNLEKIAQNGEFPAALQNLEVSNEELLEWENALKRLGQEQDEQRNIKSDLDSILTNDIFNYIDDILFPETDSDCLNNRPTNGRTAVSNDQHDVFNHVAAHLSEEQLFKKLSPNHTYSPKNGLYAHQQDTAVPAAAVICTSTQQLSHQGHPLTLPDDKVPLQLQDIFSPSIEIPELIVPNASVDDSLEPFQSCGQMSFSHMECPNGISPPIQNNLQAPAVALNGPMLQNSVKMTNNVALGMIDILPPLISCKDLNSSTAPNISVPFSTPRLPGNPAFEARKVQQWPQSQQQNLPHTGIWQNGREQTPVCNGPTPKSQTFPHAGPWQSSLTRMNHTQQGEHGQEASHRSCIFNQHFSSSPEVGDIATVLREADTSLSLSPPQGSRCLQWGPGEPTMGTSAINLGNGNIMSASEHMLNIQQYQENHQHTQEERLSSEVNGFFAAAAPPPDMALYLAE